MLTDPTSDMLTRIRNGALARHAVVSMPASRMRVEIARILKEEGLVKNYKVVRDDKQGVLKVHLKYGPDGKSVIHGIRRVSRPGRRVYVGSTAVKDVFGGIGISIVTTSRGVMTATKSREQGVGGELLCEVW